MKKLLYIVIFSTSSIAFGQSPVVVYENILIAIKSSENYKEFNLNEEIENPILKVNSALINYCQFLWSQNDKIKNPEIDCGEEHKNYTLDYVKKKEINKLSEKGKKTHWVNFSKTTNQFIAVTIYVNKKQWGNYDHLVYLFKVTTLDHLEMVDSNIQYGSCKQ